MLFNSLHFVFFFPIVVALYFATPHRWRWALLLAASYYFYGSWRLAYLVLLIACTVLDWAVALRMAGAQTPRRRRAWLIVSLTANLGMLGYFKYAGFITDSLQAVLGPMGASVPEHAALHPLLPVGISFYTFQTLAYSLDVYWRNIPAERHLGRFALYVSFFPQLVAGPIERADRLLPQFTRVHHVDGARMVSGLTRMAWGFFQKLVIADRLAPWVNEAFMAQQPQTAATVLIAAYFFYFQIYTDFAGYTDIAIGSARIMGYDLMENFNRAYLATSMSDLWRRWHISLMTWFRDYLMRPLSEGGSGPLRRMRNVMIVFVVSGLWHGAAWTFVAWGVVNGLALIIGYSTRDARDRLWAACASALSRRAPAAGSFLLGVRPWLARLFIANFLALGLIFFRAPTFERAMEMYGTIFGRAHTLFSIPALGIPPWELFLALAAIGTFLVVDGLGTHRRWPQRLAAQPGWVRWSVAYTVVFAVLMFGQFQITEFYYFRF